ncbi:MAG: hypothetical protein JSS49_30755 [Planctomycetes bacterium]|nr:hypothetical protein [Planctomycetota bacterium]
MVELLTHLGLDTGFFPETLERRKSKLARAGLEKDIRKPDAPYIVKSPWFCEYVDEVLARDDILVEHVFIPMRELRAAAESRRFVTAQSLRKMSFLKRLHYQIFPRVLPGGVTVEASHQETELLLSLYRLMASLSKTVIPVTLMRFPRIVHDEQYLFDKLEPILNGISFRDFQEAFRRVARPDLVHSFCEGDL